MERTMKAMKCSVVRERNRDQGTGTMKPAEKRRPDWTISDFFLTKRRTPVKQKDGWPPGGDGLASNAMKKPGEKVRTVAKRQTGEISNFTQTGRSAGGKRGWQGEVQTRRGPWQKSVNQVKSSPRDPKKTREWLGIREKPVSGRGCI